MAELDQRLPTHVVPRHYDIELAPDLKSARFAGTTGIDLEFSAETNELSCNAADLDIHRVQLIAAGRDVPLRFELDEAAQRLHIRTSQPVTPGPARLEVSFEGTLNDRLCGFYRSTYTDDAGIDQTIATTQFQSTDARRAFPCWDEPAFKATFSTSLVVESDLLAVSNTAEVSRNELTDGRVRIRFARTMPMSTYLVAFVVGPLEATEPLVAEGVPLRVVHRPGRSGQAEFALDVAAHAMRWFVEYYAIPYPSDKIDLIALPDFASGAMENLGCVTFREVLLLVDPNKASQPELERVAEVVNHELAHMWFGDLVTMQWWEGIWLNEAFATFMEMACSDAYRPDWEVWTTFGRMRAAAFDTDALATTRAIEYPVTTPVDAEGMFDVITYEKGASVVRMLEQYLGEVVFRDGVRHYLNRHAYGNTETSDLWESLQEISGQPVRQIIEGWIHQGGHPVIDVTLTEHGLAVEQQHFTLDPTAADDRVWPVPIRLRTQDDGGAHEQGVLLDRRRRILTRPTGDLVTANVDGTGFYRVMVDTATVEEVMRSGPGNRTTGERHALVDDLWALTLSGRVQATDYFRMVTDGFRSETDVTVWQAMTAGLGGLSRLVDGEARERFSASVGAMCEEAIARLGPETRPGDDDRTRELRATILRLRGAIADRSDAIDEARALLATPDATLAAAALTVAAHHGSREDFDRFREVFRQAEDPQTEQRHLRVLADFPDPDLVMSIVEETRRGEVRSQDGPYLIRRALANRYAGTYVWAFVTETWDELNEIFPTNSIARMLEGVVALDDPDRAHSATAFLNEHPVPQAETQIAQHLEKLHVNVALRAREAERFSAALTSI